MSNTKKSLLNENTIRRFMKLAEIDKLSDGFVTGLVKEDMEEEPFEGPSGAEGEFEVEDAVEDVEALDVAAEEPAADADTTLATELATGFAGVMEDVLGVTVQVQDETGDEAEALGDDEQEVELDLADEESPVGLEENKQLDEASRRRAILEENMRREEAYRQAVKNEVLKRVTARLQEESRKDAVADQLSERILKRIKEQTKK